MAKVKKILFILPLLVALIFTISMFTACGMGDESTHVKSFTQLQNALQKGGTIVLDQDIKDVNSVLTITKDTTLNLNSKTISSGDTLVYSEGNSETEGTWSLFVVRGATLTVTGNGMIDAKYLFTFSVQSQYENAEESAVQKANKNVESSKLIIENGTFKSGDKDDQATVVYLIGKGSTCQIKGGDFSVSTQDKSWVLNTEDSSEKAAGKSLFSITGGTFHDFDPSKVYPTFGHDSHNRVAEGYKAEQIAQTENYKVVPEEE